MSKLPDPRGHRLLVKMKKPVTKTAGGILLSDKTQEDQMYLEISAEVVAIGPGCWKEKLTGKPWPGGDWCKVGDQVVIPRYTPFKMEIDEEQYRIINDDEVIATIDDPSVIKIWV